MTPLEQNLMQLLDEQSRQVVQFSEQLNNYQTQVQALLERVNQAEARFDQQCQALQKLLGERSTQSTAAATNANTQQDKLEKGLVHLAQQLKLLKDSHDTLTKRLTDLETWAKD